MKTLDGITILDYFACALLPVCLQMNNGKMKVAVTKSYGCALEVLRQRKSFHNRALERSESPAGPQDAAMFNERIVRPREDPAWGEE
jgi:hypothetical protein